MGESRLVVVGQFVGNQHAQAARSRPQGHGVSVAGFGLNDLLSRNERVYRAKAALEQELLRSGRHAYLEGTQLRRAALADEDGGVVIADLI